MVLPPNRRWQGVYKVLEKPKVDRIPNEKLPMWFLEFDCVFAVEMLRNAVEMSEK